MNGRFNSKTRRPMECRKRAPVRFFSIFANHGFEVRKKSSERGPWNGSDGLNNEEEVPLGLGNPPDFITKASLNEMNDGGTRIVVTLFSGSASGKGFL